MLTIDIIKNNIQNYKIENGIIVDKKDNTPVQDEDKLLEIKSSFLIYKEAKNNYIENVQIFGKEKTPSDPDKYIVSTMDKFGINGVENHYGINKLIRAILSSNGHYEEYMSGNNLQESKFSILISPKKDYGIAYLKMLFREKGLDIDNLTISLDESDLVKNGVSRVIIDYVVKKYDKKSNFVEHPKSQELNELQEKLNVAKNNNDKVEYNNLKQQMKQILLATSYEVSARQWDSMSLQDKIKFLNIKVNESKIIGDEDDFKYWSSNLKYYQDELVKQNSLGIENSIVNK